MKFDAIILAAGRGKRMKPFSDVISKPMLPLLNKPLISLIAEQLIRLGADKIVITVSLSNQEELLNYFQQQSYSPKIQFCLQNPPQGTADAIYKAGLLCTSDVIFSMAGDNLFSEEFCKTMIHDFFNNRELVKSVITLIEVTKEEITKLASVTMNKSGLITNIVEKPKLEEVESTLASYSMYIFDKTLLKFFGSVPLSARGEYEAPDAFLAILNEQNKFKIKGLVTKEHYVHMSNPTDLWKFNMAYLKKETNIYGENSKIGERISIKHCVIGNNVTIEDDCNLMNSVILDNVIIPKHSTIKNSIVGSSEKGIEIVKIDEEN